MNVATAFWAVSTGLATIICFLMSLRAYSRRRALLREKSLPLSYHITSMALVRLPALMTISFGMFFFVAVDVSLHVIEPISRMVVDIVILIVSTYVSLAALALHFRDVLRATYLSNKGR